MFKLAPVTLKEANAYVDRQHRHHKPTAEHKFSIGCKRPDGTLASIAIVGWPAATQIPL